MRPVKIKIQFPFGHDIAMGPDKAELLAVIHRHGSHQPPLKACVCLK